MKLFNFKKGAVFGADARLAIVIFGAISLVSGYNIYYAYIDSQVKRVTIESKEVVKALKAYEYDVDDETPEFATAVLNIGELVTSVKNNWKGPYIGYDRKSGADANRYLMHKQYGQFSILKAKGRAPISVSESPFVACDDSEPCYWWILFDGAEMPETIKNGLDELIDSGDGFLSGLVQKYDTGLLYRLERIEFYTAI